MEEGEQGENRVEVGEGGTKSNHDETIKKARMISYNKFKQFKLIKLSIRNVFLKEGSLKRLLKKLLYLCAEWKNGSIIEFQPFIGRPFFDERVVMSSIDSSYVRYYACYVVMLLCC